MSAAFAATAIGEERVRALLKIPAIGLRKAAANRRERAPRPGRRRH
jgi:hypothetical protein